MGIYNKDKGFKPVAYYVSSKKYANINLAIRESSLKSIYGCSFPVYKLGKIILTVITRKDGSQFIQDYNNIGVAFNSRVILKQMEKE